MSRKSENGEHVVVDEPPHLTRRSLRLLPRSIWALGLGSLFMDTSSELVSLLPILMSSVLGASMVTIGVVEGIAICELLGQ